MKLFELLRKGVGYLFMCMGISRPGTKAQPGSPPAPKPRS